MSLSSDSVPALVQSPDTSVTVFATEDVTKVYEMGEVEVQALRGVDLELFEREFVVLLGPSGSGKSTLLNILGGLDMPTTGIVRYRDQEITAFDDAAMTRYRRDHVGFVFQFYNLIPSLTAKENVALVTEVALNPMEPEDALGLVGLADRVDHFPAQLSGGEQQRVAIARALANGPGLLLADEPTGNLDPATSARVLDLLVEVVREAGTAAFIATHNPDIAAAMDRTLELADGRLRPWRPVPASGREEVSRQTTPA